MCKKRLLLISQSGRGGLRKHLCDLLLNVDYDKFEIWIVYNNKEVDDIFRRTIKQLSGKVKPILVDSFVRDLNFKNDIKTYFRINKIIKKIKPDIVHCHSSKAGVLGRLAAKNRNIKKIYYTPHWYSFLSPEFSPLKRKLFIEIEKNLSKHMTTKTFNTSKGEKDSAINYKIDISEKFKVIYNGLPDVEFPKRNDIRRELCVPEDAFLLGNSARLSHQKNPKLFIDIANKVIKEDKTIHFIWIGDGPLKEKIKKKVDEYNIVENIHLIGYKENSEFLVSGFDGFFSTSNGESFGYSAVEALRAGIPLLLSDVMGHNEVCLPNENGLLFNANNESKFKDIVFEFIDFSKTINTEDVKDSFKKRFSLDQMIEKICDEYTY